MKAYINSLIQQRRARARLNEVLRLDDRTLADIGMSRFDLTELARSGR